MRQDTHMKSGKTLKINTLGKDVKHVKALCGWVSKAKNLKVTKDEKDVSCSECLDILLDNL